MMNNMTSMTDRQPAYVCKTAVLSPQPKCETAVPQSKFHIRIDNLETRENKLSIKMPVELFRVGLAIARNYNLRLARLNWDDVQVKIERMCLGALLDERDEVRNERIQIFVEFECL